MMRSVLRKAGILGLMLFLTPLVFAQTPCENWVAKVVSIQGAVDIRRGDAENWSPARLEELLCEGDVIRVMDLSRAAIMLPNDAVVRLDQKTTVSLTPPKTQTSYLLDLIEGAVHFFSRVPRSLRIHTPFVNGTIEGTEVALAHSGEGTRVALLEGKLRIENDRGHLMLASGDAAIVPPGEAPAADPAAAGLDRIQWALYYPPIYGLEPSAFGGTADSAVAEPLRQAAADFRRGDVSSAFERLDGEIQTSEEAEFHAFRASLLLFVGRVDEALSDIGTLRRIDPANAAADALEAVIAAVQNRKEEARRLADSAVAKDPASAPALIAQSFARQAAFDIEGAGESLVKATAIEPGNALAWARLAELQLAMGEVDAAGTSSEKAASLMPELSRIQWVRGFSQLTRIRIDEALLSFASAVQQDSADPLARLGLGLAQIRKGQLESGRRNIEIAAALDPANSLLRSYLGKAYFEEKRDPHAGRQYEMAKILDPGDPTPWFYDALRKQTENRPVEALEDIQKSIELNDNRAVYRSRFLLDQDLAARSAALGRIYRDLGFEQLGLLEGYKSVNTAPANYSAHRLLADTYSSKPRHELARVSELLQSQLLQPLNVTPLQPHLGVSDLQLIQGSGPSDVSFNEFNPLFLRNNLSLQASVVAGGNDTFGEELVHAGIVNNLSYSIGQFHYETDGFDEVDGKTRENNEQRQDIYTAFVQTALSHDTHFQVEVRKRDINRGDTDILFDAEAYAPFLEEDLETITGRVGFHHRISPGSDFLFSYITHEVDDEQKDRFSELVELAPGFFLPFEGNTLVEEIIDNRSLEVQHIFDKNSFKLITGTGYGWGEISDAIQVNFTSPPIDTPPVRTDEATRVWNMYAYSQMDILKNLTIVGGLSYDDLDYGGSNRRDQINPKAGLIWSPWQKTTLRLAGFRHLTRNLVSDQTVEPTQVAGFNQFYDDVIGTESWNIGAAVDHQISNELFSGVEFTYRWLEVPYETLETTGDLLFDRTDWRERVGRAYLYWTPHPYISLKTEYLYELFDERGEFQANQGFVELETHRLKLGGGFFHPSGLFTKLQSTYVDQRGEFADMVETTPNWDDGNQFWVVDAAIGYRFPKRLGTVSLECLNLFDESFKFQDTDPANPSIAPDRWVLVRLSLNF
ncbi:MAG: TonB-dependent receptor domain-containing protein [Desulfobacterales bacterium]